MSDINSDFLSVPVESDVSLYMHQKAGRLGIPVSGNFELTPRCNFNCKMCYIHSENKGMKKNELSAADWLRIGKDAADSGMVFLLLTGGEPLLREDFAEIYTGLKKQGLMISVNTNGSLLEGEILKLFEKEPPTRLNISLYGADDSTYENLCENRCFSRVAKNIETVVGMGIQVKLNYSITPYNCDDMAEIYSFAKKLKLHVQSSSYMYPPLRSGQTEYGENQGRFSPEEAAFYRIKSEQLYLGAQRFEQKAEKLKKYICDTSSKPMKKDCRSHCRAGRSNFWVDWQGNMGMCGMIPASENNNVLKNGFSQCWENVKKEADGIRLPEKCSECKYSAICNICAAVCLCETGSYSEAPEYLCKYSRLTCENIMRTKGE